MVSRFLLPLINVSAVKVVLVLATGLLGIISLGGGVTGYLLCNCKVIERIFLFVAALNLIFYGLATDAVGIVLFVGVVLSQYRRKRVQQAI